MKYKGLINKALSAAVCAGVIIAQSFQLNWSAMPSFSILFSQGFVLIILNALTIALIDLLLVLVFIKWKTALLFSSAFFTAWSIANYYVIEFHGSPIFFSELFSFGAAIAVIGGYSYRITKAVIGILLIFVFEIFLILIGFSKNRDCSLDKKQALKNRLASFLFTAVFFYIGFFSPAAVKPAVTMGWTWMTGVEEYGYISCLIEDALKIRNPINKPENYSPPIIPIESDFHPPAELDRPDIIFIINESFCDLGYHTMIKSEDSMRDFYAVENAAQGWAAVPNIGGGTNDTEYEVLTSNAMALVSVKAPFNYPKLRKTQSNVIIYLESIGYESYGMHCGGKDNYSRSTAYPQFGFDNVLLGQEAFSHFSQYGNRDWLDEDNYHDLIDLYEKAGNSPRFMYLLTFQNHGGWEQNEPKFDRIHIDLDLGELTDDVEEYLTSISMSADAFADLTDYFSKVDRHVIICMVGDHAPSFITKLPSKKQLSFEENEISERIVPYIIWANYDVSFPEYTENASAIDLIPMVLDTAKLPLTAYYKFILNLHNVVPVRIRNGVYMDREGKIGVYDTNSEYYELIRLYYCMEYDALAAKENNKSMLFELR